ncbi:MAG: TrmB family transcriptional regulator [Candidatus Hodarchaeales archaeon]|jgi:DNA-binding transcriptional regulator GbsR (MarR family)
MPSNSSERENRFLSNQDFSEVKERVKDLFDLSENESDVYMKLLVSEKATANEISRITGIQRTRTYEIFRRLREKNLISLTSENPQRYSVVSPRIAVDNWLLKRRQLLEKRSSLLISLLPTLQKIWSDQHEELMGSRVSLISKDLVREIIPQEIEIAQKRLFLALKDPSPDSSSSHGHAASLFDPYSFNAGIKSLLKRGVVLHILLGNPDLFLQKSHSIMLKTLVNGIIDGTIEVRALNKPFPQSFLLVDDERVYLFFLSPEREIQNEALRAESQSLRSLFSLVWERFWEEAAPISLEKVLEMNKRSTRVKRSI